MAISTPDAAIRDQPFRRLPDRRAPHTGAAFNIEAGTRLGALNCAVNRIGAFPGVLRTALLRLSAFRRIEHCTNDPIRLRKLYHVQDPFSVTTLLLDKQEATNMPGNQAEFEHHHTIPVSQN